MRENILTNLKILKIYQVTTQKKRQTFPSKEWRNKIMTLTRIYLTDKLPIVLKVPINHFETSNKFAPSQMEYENDISKLNQQIQHSQNQWCPTKSQFSNNDKSVSDFKRKRGPDVYVIENYKQNFITVKIPGKSNNASIST